MSGYPFAHGENHMRLITKCPNPALNLAPFGRWTLRDKAAQRRLALRWAHPINFFPQEK
jgi:hypothetical protein